MIVNTAGPKHLGKLAYKWHKTLEIVIRYRLFVPNQ